MTTNDIDAVLAALRARQDAEYAYQKAFWTCLAHTGEFPSGWVERRAELWKVWDRAIEKHCRVYLRVKRRINGDR